MAMKTLGSFLMAALVAVPVLAQNAAEAPVPVNLQVGQKVTVLLDGNPTTGFIWRQAETLPADAPVTVDLRCVTQEEGGMCCGFPTPTSLTITAVKPGTQVVRVVYARPWEKGKAPLREKSFAVKVTPAAE